MSGRQYGTLKFIETHRVNMQHVRLFNLTTLGSLLQNGWVEKKTGGLLGLTARGHEAYEQYDKAKVSYRKQEGEISERVALMLHLGRQTA